MNKHSVLVLLVSLFLIFFSASGEGDSGTSFSPYVDETGAINLPSGYRSTWAYLGSWVVPDGKAPGHGYHDVFTQPESVESYKKTGKFPDGTVLIKEIRKVKSDKLTTGDASYAGEIGQWFVMIKDGQGRFPESSNWGEGWGWALFYSKDPGKNVSTDYRKDCIGCHIPAKSTDWVYVQGYPTLR